MVQLATLPFLAHFTALQDPRQAAKVLYPLPELLLLLLCGTVAGADDFVELALWGGEHLLFLRRFLPFTRGIPSHDTLCEVVAALDPALFKVCFTNWVERLRDPGPETIAVDGKTSRRSHARSKGRGPLHTVSAWATGQRFVLGQEAVSEKSNEITAIPLLLQRLELAGALVTIDAMGTQTAIARTVLDGGGDYVLALKQNQPGPCAKVEALFAAPPVAMAISTHRTVEGGHGRLEARTHQVCHDVSGLLSGRGPLANWPFRAWPWLAWSKARLTATAGSGASGVITSARPSSMPKPSPAWCAAIGGSRTAYTGCSTWCSATTWPGSGQATAPRRCCSDLCGNWLSGVSPASG